MKPLITPSKAINKTGMVINILNVLNWWLFSLLNLNNMKGHIKKGVFFNNKSNALVKLEDWAVEINVKINGSVKKKKKHLFFFDKASLLGLKNENTSEAPKKSELKKKEKKDALSDKKKK